MSVTFDSDVVIVGAGISGLVAAQKAAASGLTPLVLEARDRVGGRTLSRELAGEVIDLGGQWFGPRQRHALALIDELGLTRFPQFSRGRKVLELSGSRTTYRGTIPGLPLLSLLELQFNIWRYEWLARKVETARLDSARQAESWDHVTAAAMFDRHVTRKDARALIDIAARAIFAAEPSEFSFLYFLFYLRAGGGFMQLIELENGAQAWRLRGGAQQLAQRLADRIAGQVRLGEPVVRLEQRSDGVTAITREGKRYSARRAIVAVPPALANEIVFEPALPAARQLAHAKMPMGSVIKCIVAYDRAYWREMGFSGEAVSNSGTVRLCFDDCGENGSHPALVCFLLGDSARAATSLPQEERKRVVLDDLARLFGPWALHAKEYVDHDWIAEQFSRGCYVGLMPPGIMTAIGDALRAPVGRLHWAGTETATESYGYIDGAIQAGKRAAEEVVRAVLAEQPHGSRR